MPLVWNELLGVEAIKICQDTDAFNFSLDSILLANFASVLAGCKNICDLCSGNAPIPLYLSLRSKANIVGIEIQKPSYDLANLSIKENHLEDRIKMINANLIGISDIIGTNKYDLVTCNPPFFKVGNNKINPNDKLAISRHELYATLDDVVLEASKLLKQKGRFAMVHRPDRLVEILEVFKKYHIEPKRLRFVYPRADRDCNHILIEGIKEGSSGSLKILSPLYVYENDKWTKEILKIYNLEE